MGLVLRPTRLVTPRPPPYRHRMTAATSPCPDLFLMSPPRPDWRIRGSANVFSQAGSSAEVLGGGAALREWLALADAMTAAGATIAVLPFTDDATLTGMPYTAEAGLLGHDADGPLFMLPRVKPPHREGEAFVIAQRMASWGLRTWRPPVLWEGQGDVLDAGAGRRVCTSGDGPHARTSQEAFDHIAPFLPGASLHLRFHGDPWFHGNTFLGFFHGAQETLALVCEDALLPGEGARLRAFLPDMRFVGLTAEESLSYATNALQVGRVVLAPRGVPAHVQDAWRGAGLLVQVVELPILFGRGGGAAVCMTNRLPLPRSAVPAAALYNTMRGALAAAAGLP